MPIHLAPHASLSFSVGALIRRGAPDRNGQVIPPNIVQGSARIAGLTGSHKQRLSVVVTAGIFNSRTGTCSCACFFCIGGQFADFSPDSLSLPMTNSGQLAMMVTFTNGDVEDYSSDAAFVSNDTSIASQSGSQTTGVAIGGTTVEAFVSVAGGDGCTCTGAQGCGVVNLFTSTPVYVTPEIFMGLNGSGPTQNITGLTESVIVGQQVQLAASYSMPAGYSTTGVSWSVASTGGNTVFGGWTPGSAPSAIGTTGNSTTIHWIAPGSSLGVELNLNYNDSSGNPQQSLSEAWFNIAGPTGFQLSATSGSWSPTNEGLQLGCDINCTGVSFDAGNSVQSPQGATNNFEWVQIVTQWGANVTINNTSYPCTFPATPRLDTGGFPYSTSSKADDNPFISLDTSWQSVIYNISGTMYRLWRPGLKDDIAAPIRSINWSAQGRATYNSQATTWTVDTNSSYINIGSFAPTQYPTWSPPLANAVSCP